nr:MAG TPA_asm: hypothetical protein [Caudoviricetes sp.]
MTCVTNTTRRELLVVLVSNFAFFSLYSKERQSPYSLSLRQIIVLTNEVLKVIWQVFVSTYAVVNSLVGVIGLLKPLLCKLLNQYCHQGISE